MSKNLFEGIITPMVTPLTDRENIDIKGLEKLLDHLVNGGVNGIFLMGTTGEGTSISYRMRNPAFCRICQSSRTYIRKHCRLLYRRKFEYGSLCQGMRCHLSGNCTSILFGIDSKRDYQLLYNNS